MVVLLFHHYRLGASAAKLTGDGFVTFIINNGFIIVNNKKILLEKGACFWLRYCDFAV
jgi:hypothetical protein